MTQYLEKQLNRLREQIAADETLQALDELRNLSAAVPEVYTTVLLQQSRYVRVEREERKGVITHETATVEKTRINNAILYLIDELPAKLTAEKMPVSPPPAKVAEAVTIPAALHPEKILGINNLKQIAWIAQGLECARSVCRILTPEGLGTGFLVDSDLLMTNNHVIPSEKIAGETVIEFNYQLDTGGSFETTYRYHLDPGRFHTSPALDYTLVAVTPDPTKLPLENWGRLRLNPNADPVPTEHVSIIQHPNGGLKQIVITANRVVKVQNAVLLYTTDTMPGSSGSPVFNDAWQVIAIHHAAPGVNEGILMSHIKPDAQAAGLWPAA